MVLDIKNPPKYCPQCAKSEIRSKVKSCRMKDGTIVIMCKNGECPWPFSEYSKEEVTISDERKEEKSKTQKESDEVFRKGAETSQKRKNEDSSEKSKSKSVSGSKRQKTTQEVEPKLFHNSADSNSASSDDQSMFIIRNIEKDSNKNKNLSPDHSIFPEPADQDDPLMALLSGTSEDHRHNLPQTQQSVSKESDGKLESTSNLTEAEIFKVMPEAIRKPMKLPKHAMHMLDSKLTDDDLLNETEIVSAGQISTEGELDDLSELDLDGSDSELESLVSVCSTMTQISGQSIEGEGRGLGKIKKRGKKKKRKDRRKLHSQKCSKVQLRHSDISSAAALLCDDPEPEQTDSDGDNHVDDIVQEENVDDSLENMSIDQQDEELPDLDVGQESGPLVEMNEGVLEEVMTTEKRPLKRENRISSDESIGQKPVVYCHEDLYLYYEDEETAQPSLGIGDQCVGFSFVDPRSCQRIKCPAILVLKENLDDLFVILKREEQVLKGKVNKTKVPRDTGKIQKARSRLDKAVLGQIRSCFTFKWIEKQLKKQKKEESTDRRLSSSASSRTSPMSSEVEKGSNQPSSSTQDSEIREPPVGKAQEENPRTGDEIVKQNGNAPNSTVEVFDCILDVVEKPSNTEQQYSIVTEESIDKTFKKPAPPTVAVKMDSSQLQQVASGSDTGTYFTLMDPLSPMPPTPRTVDNSQAQDDEAQEDSSLPDIDPQQGLNNIEIVGVEAVTDDQDHVQAETETDSPETCSDVKPKMRGIKAEQLPIRNMPSLSNRLMLNTGIEGISIKTVDVHIDERKMQPTRFSPEELDRSLYTHTLSQLDLEREDDELSKVWKLATGSASPPTLPTCETSSKELSPTNKATSSTVFHVARTNCIDLPQQMNTLEISSRDSNRVLLTANSDQVEAQALKPSGLPINSGRKRYNRKLECGDGWFTWRSLKVDSETCMFYDDYVRDMEEKWKCDMYKAFNKEREEKPGVKEVLTAQQFYVQVLSKIHHLEQQYGLKRLDCIEFVKSRFRQKNVEFFKDCKEIFRGDMIVPEEIQLKDILSVETIHKLANPAAPRVDVTQHLPEGLVEKMITMKGLIPPPQSVMVKPDIQIKEESADPYSYGTSVAIIDPASVMSVNQSEVIGEGDMCIQFFYENPSDGAKVAFRPVNVRDEEDIKAVIALCTERAAEYKYKCGLIDKPELYYSESVRAKTRLDPKVIRFIESCFTHRGMKQNRIDYERKSNPRPKIARIYKVKNLKEEANPDDDLEEDDVMAMLNESSDDSHEADIEEFDPEPERSPQKCKEIHEPIDNSERVLEERVFGSNFPYMKRDRKILTKKRKVQFKVQEVDNRKRDPYHIISTVQFLLDTQDEEDDQELKQANTLKLSSLFKSSRRRVTRKKSESSSDDDLEEEDFYPEDLYYNREDTDTRKSDRIKTKFKQIMEPKLDATPQKASSSKQAIAVKKQPKTVAREIVPSPTRRVTFDDKEVDSPELPTSYNKRRVVTPEIQTSQSEKEVNSPVATTSQANSSRPFSTSPIERALSQLSNRPSSQEGSRPCSSLERPKSRVRGYEGKGMVEEPKADSPVLAPRKRHELLEIARIVKFRNTSPRGFVGVKPVPDPVLSSEDKQPKQSIAVDEKLATTNLNKFDQINVRKSKQDKVRKLLDKQKRKAEKNKRRKMRGFGQKEVIVVETDLTNKPPRPVKKAQVSKEESDLIESLLRDATQAVSGTSSQVVAEDCSGDTIKLVSTVRSQAEMIEFQESKGIMDNDTSLDDILSGL